MKLFKIDALLVVFGIVILYFSIRLLLARLDENKINDLAADTSLSFKSNMEKSSIRFSQINDPRRINNMRYEHLNQISHDGLSIIEELEEEEEEDIRLELESSHDIDEDLDENTKTTSLDADKSLSSEFDMEESSLIFSQIKEPRRENILDDDLLNQISYFDLSIIVKEEDISAEFDSWESIYEDLGENTKINTQGSGQGTKHDKTNAKNGTVNNNVESEAHVSYARDLINDEVKTRYNNLKNRYFKLKENVRKSML